jgi:hypothetical protein
MGKNTEAVDALAPFRRVVTGVDNKGNSTIVEDGPPSTTLTVDARPGFRSADLYRTVGGQLPPGDSESEIKVNSLLPPSDGTVLRVVDFPPEAKDPVEYRRQAAETLGALSMDSTPIRSKSLRHPLMHALNTIDYVIVTHGEIYAVMEEGEVLLTVGDVLIQRGTSHAWSNRSDKVARLVFVLIDGKPPEAQPASLQVTKV